MTTRRISITMLDTGRGFSAATNELAGHVAAWLAKDPDVMIVAGEMLPSWWQAAQLALDPVVTGERVAHSGGETSNPVLAAVLGRERAVTHAEEVLGHLAEAHTHLAAAVQLMARQTRRVNAVELAKVKDATSCAGMTLQGYGQWGDPLCTKPRASASYPQHFQSGEYPAELCLDCITHWRRWGADPGYVREHKTDGRRGARLDGANQRAGVDNLLARLNRVEIEGAA